MRKHIIKHLENTKVIIPAAVIVAAVLGFFAYRDLGTVPKVDKSMLNESISSASAHPYGFQDGEEASLAFAKGGRVSTVYVRPGDLVQKGEKLAELDSTGARGALDQARSAYEAAKANYEKILNGASDSELDVLKTAVSNAENNLSKTQDTEATLVKNAYASLLNSDLKAVLADGTSDFAAPAVSGTYALGKEGTIKIHLYFSTGGLSFVASGLVSGTGMSNTVTPQPIGDSGLYITFPSSRTYSVQDWVIDIPNKQASNYSANQNAYQLALAGQSQAVSAAQAVLDQAQAALDAKLSVPRYEDIAAAKAQMDGASGALQSAQDAYNNDFLYAPEGGSITVVNVRPGDIAQAGAEAVGMVVKISN